MVQKYYYEEGGGGVSKIESAKEAGCERTRDLEESQQGIMGTRLKLSKNVWQ